MLFFACSDSGIFLIRWDYIRGSPTAYLRNNDFKQLIFPFFKLFPCRLHEYNPVIQTVSLYTHRSLRLRKA